MVVFVRFGILYQQSCNSGQNIFDILHSRSNIVSSDSICVNMSGGTCGRCSKPVWNASPPVSSSRSSPSGVKSFGGGLLPGHSAPRWLTRSHWWTWTKKQTMLNRRTAVGWSCGKHCRWSAHCWQLLLWLKAHFSKLSSVIRVTCSNASICVTPSATRWRHLSWKT